MGSPRFLGVGGGGKSDAVGAGGGGCGTGGGSGAAAAAFLECANGDLFVTMTGGPCEWSVIEIGTGALLGGSGGSRFTCCSAATFLSELSALSFDGDRFVVPSRFCLFPNGALGVEAACCTGTIV